MLKKKLSYYLIMEFKDIFGGILILGLVAAIIVMAAIKPQYSFSLEPAKDVLTVSGDGTVTTMPDEAEIYINIFTQGETAEEAKNLNSEISANVIDALDDEGISKDDIETYSFNLYPRQKYIEEEETYIITGYELRNVLKATTKEIDEAGKFIDAAVSAGANSIDRVVFDLTTERQEEIDREALAKATDVAKARATAMAEAAGVELQKLVSVDGSSSYQPFFARPEATRVMGAAEETAVLPQDLEVSATAKLVYEII